MLQLIRVIAVIALLIVAAALATPKGKLPLALRGVYRILRRDRGMVADPPEVSAPSVLRRTLAFVLVIIALALAIW